MTATGSVQLVTPSLHRLAEYVVALRAGWSPNTTRDVSGEQLAAIHQDASAFIAELNRREGGTVTLAGGRAVPRIPGRIFWIWDGAFCGSINLRYLPGTEDLPPHVSGHAGYAVVPWKRGRGYAAHALRLLLPVAREAGMPRILVTCDADNTPSRRVVEAAGGRFAGDAPSPEHGGGRKLLFWVPTGAGAPS